MAWEIETEHIDLDRMMHVTRFIERSVKTIHGVPARHELLIQLRTEPTLDANGKPVGGEVILHEDGRLRDTAGAHFDHKARQSEELKKLMKNHELARKFAAHHQTPIFTGPKR
jgi:hypothetical protein